MMIGSWSAIRGSISRHVGTVGRRLLLARAGALVPLLLLLTSSVVAASPADEVREAETGFATAFAERDVKRFANYIAWDATFIVRGKPVRGRDEVVKSWGDLLATPAPPFSWKQEQAYVDEAGTSAMSIGSVFDPEGNRVATFTSYWRKQDDGWRVVFDGPAAPVCPKPK